MPQLLGAQVPGDSVLLSVPADSVLKCRDESNLLPHGGPPGARAFAFEIGGPVNVIRDATGHVFFPGMAPREIDVAFDSGGAPLALADAADITRWRHGTVIAYFPPGAPAFGMRQVSEADSAAVMARVQRDGLGALTAAVQEAMRNGPREQLDSATLGRARDLAIHFWSRRCP